MFIENDLYKIEIVRDETFTLNSADNKQYDVILNPNNFKKSDYYKAFFITIDDNKKCIILIGSPYGADENMAILEGDNLIVLMDKTISVIDCNTLALKLRKEISADGACFSIYEFENGYVIRGEIEILKLSSEFEVEWSFSGADIFVTLDGSIPFDIKDDLIYLTDWNGTKYIVNKFGELVC